MDFIIVCIVPLFILFTIFMGLKEKKDIFKTFTVSCRHIGVYFFYLLSALSPDGAQLSVLRYVESALRILRR